MTGVPIWHSLYLKSDQSATVALKLVPSLEQLGYRRYDPFPGGAGTPPGLTQYMRLFVAPQQDSWVRVLGSPDLACLPELSYIAPVLHLWLDETASGRAFFREGERDDEALVQFLAPGRSQHDLRQLEEGLMPVGLAENNDHGDRQDEAFSIPSGIPLDVEGLTHLASDHDVNPAQARQLIDQLS